MFNLFGKKVELKSGQVWESKNKNPFQGTWRERITEVRNGYVKYVPFYVDENGNPMTIGGVELWEHSRSEKDFRYFNTVLVCQ